MITGCSDADIESMLDQVIAIQEANTALDINAETDVNLVGF